MLTGTYVPTFAEATHALPDKMPINADYPYKSPTIVNLTATAVTLEGRNVRDTAAIQRDQKGREFCELSQQSSYERLYHKAPTTFRFWPFKEVSLADRAAERSLTQERDEALEELAILRLKFDAIGGGRRPSELRAEWAHADAQLTDVKAELRRAGIELTTAVLGVDRLIRERNKAIEDSVAASRVIQAARDVRTVDDPALGAALPMKLRALFAALDELEKR